MEGGGGCADLGGTKNGCLGVEAVVLFEPARAWEFELRRKRGGHLFSKHRFLSAQMEAYLADGLWLDLARRANARAARAGRGDCAAARGAARASRSRRTRSSPPGPGPGTVRRRQRARSTTSGRRTRAWRARTTSRCRRGWSAAGRRPRRRWRRWSGCSRAGRPRMSKVYEDLRHPEPIWNPYGMRMATKIVGIRSLMPVHHIGSG